MPHYEEVRQNTVSKTIDRVFRPLYFMFFMIIFAGRFDLILVVFVLETDIADRFL